MATAGYNFAGQGINYDPPGETNTAAWTNPGNITSDDNNVASIIYFFPTADKTQYLVATQFNFAVESSTINGITVAIGAKASQSQVIYMQLRDASGTLVGSAKSKSITTVSESEFIYGGEADMWGSSLNYTDINSSEFGVSIWSTGFVYATDIDYVKIQVTYTPLGAAARSRVFLIT